MLATLMLVLVMLVEAETVKAPAVLPAVRSPMPPLLLLLVAAWPFPTASHSAEQSNPSVLTGILVEISSTIPMMYLLLDCSLGITIGYCEEDDE